MRVLKQEIQQQILSVARKEFIQHGFKGTTMRSIAQKAGIALGNIYNYFQNKDELFQTILEPLLKKFDEISHEHNESEKLTLNVFYSQEHQRQEMNQLISLVNQFRSELNLLLFQSHGSRLESYRDILCDQYTEIGNEYLKQMKKKYPRLNSQVSQFFLHAASSWWLSILGEIVSHDLSQVELETFINEYVTFATEGWRKLMNA